MTEACINNDACKREGDDFINGIINRLAQTFLDAKGLDSKLNALVLPSTYNDKLKPKSILPGASVGRIANVFAFGDYVPPAINPVGRKPNAIIIRSPEMGLEVF